MIKEMAQGKQGKWIYNHIYNTFMLSRKSPFIHTWVIMVTIQANERLRESSERVGNKLIYFIN